MITAMKPRVLLTALFVAVLGWMLAVSLTGEAKADNDTIHKVWVCKYVGQPGVDERLQTGQNPINVDYHSLDGSPAIGVFFTDRQGRSIVIAIDTGQMEPGISDCPSPPNEPPTTTSTTLAPTTTTTLAPETTTTTCPDCGINTVVIIPTSTTAVETTAPPTPGTQVVPTTQVSTTIPSVTSTSTSNTTSTPTSTPISSTPSSTSTSSTAATTTSTPATPSISALPITS